MAYFVQPPLQREEELRPFWVQSSLASAGAGVSFLDTIFPQRPVPVPIPDESVLASVGNTPIQEIDSGVFAKLEGFNFSGSIKDRAVLSMVLKMIESGKLEDGSTLALTTSGSAGVSLVMIQEALREEVGIDIRVVIVMPKAYEEKVTPQRMLDMGAHKAYNEPAAIVPTQILFLDGPFVDVMQQASWMAKANGWSVLDQHYDANGMIAHKSTAMELMLQVPDLTDVCVGTGSGATAAGLRAFLPDTVKVHSRPTESGMIDGLSDINRYDNFCDATSLDGYYTDDGKLSYFDPSAAVLHQQELKEEHNLNCGMSSGATLWLARRVKKMKPDAKVACIAADAKVRV